MLKTLKNNKKGQLSGFISSITDTIGHFISTIPPIGKALLFLLFLTFFGFVFSLLFGLTGYHCDAQNNLYKISAFNVVSNIQMMFDKPTEEDISATTFPAKERGAALPCIAESNQSTYHFWQSTCVNCTEQQVTLIDDTSITGYKTYADSCVGDVYRTPNSQKPFYKRWTCQDDGGAGFCDIPVNYFFNSTIGRYQCENLDICGNITVGTAYSQRLAEKGNLIPQNDDTSRSYKRAFSVSCQNTKAQFKFYKIPVFDFRLWLMATVLIALITAFLAIKNL